MRVLVACEYSGRVRDAFRRLGHDAMSCDLLPTEVEGPHYQGDVRDVIGQDWDLMVAHPPCTHLAVSGARWFKDKLTEQAEALEFVRMLMDAPIPRIAIENPISIISSRIRKPDQVIQPWQFGHGETKATCLWLKGLPKLTPTNIVEGREARVHRMPPGPDRWKERSRTFEGVANAMAEQYSLFICDNEKITKNTNEPFQYNGIDRIDSGAGYEESNVVPCCFICNRAKGNMPANEFHEWVKKIAAMAAQWGQAPNVVELRGEPRSGESSD